MKPDIFKKIRWGLKTWQQIAVPGSVAIAVVVLVRLTGALQPLEWAAFDRFLRWRPAEAADPRIVIIGIDEDDIRRVKYPVPDAQLAALLQKLNSYKPRVIGVDIFRDLPVEPGHAALAQAFKQMPNVIGIEKSVLPDPQNATVAPPPDLPPEQVGFADYIPDRDGYIRRNLISSPRLKGGYGFSLGLRLAELYLKAQGIEMDNGIQDKQAIRFGQAELTRLQPNDGAYIREDTGGNQLLMNWRNNAKSFRILSLKDVETNNFTPEMIQNRIVIIGMTAAYSAKDTVSVPAIADEQIFGVEFHAHSASQIISAALDGRPLLKTWHEGWEYTWIIVWGGIGIVLGYLCSSPIRTFLLLVIGSSVLSITAYTALVLSWWIPLVPTLFAFLGGGIVTRYIQDLRSLIEQRQKMIDQRQKTLDEAFNALHNGPLHTLAEILSTLKVGDLQAEKLIDKLQGLDRELREVYESIRPDSQAQQVSAPMHELLFEVYYKTLKRDFAGFKELKLKIPDIHPIDDFYLTSEQKRELCIFFEEALCNVGKHALGATRLKVVCKQEKNWCTLQVIDNGTGTQPTSTGKERGGTKQAQDLAKQLGGSFQRSPQAPQGMLCELTWPVAKT